MRYCTFLVEGIVKHDYYKSPKFQHRRQATNIQLQKVLTQLEQVADLMDIEAVERERQRQIVLKRQQEERLRRQREEEKRRFEELQKRIEQQKNYPKQQGGDGGATSIEESAFAKLQRLSQPQSQLQSRQPSSAEAEAAKRVSFQLGGDDESPKPEPDGHSFRMSTSDRRIDPDQQQVEPLPPPLLPPGGDGDDDLPFPLLPPSGPGPVSGPGPGSESGPTAPPSYHQILETSRLANHSYFGPGAEAPRGRTSNKISPAPEPPLPSYDQVVPKIPKKVSVRNLKSESERLYAQYQYEGLIQISAFATYQGRNGTSTNGCTVISALVAARHLQTHGGVTDTQVNNVIDSECGPLLREIRSKLQLSESSLIIPSDVHDHLVDHKILYQHKFVGAAGGNIVDPDHLGEVCRLLEGNVKDNSRHLKSAATLFFHEHVVSIVKFPTSPTEAVYDLVDSLPTVQKMGSSRASRTRCKDMATLRALLQWYACKKFSESNCAYMDRNPWDESMADFDPRVFQAFVWADLPKPTMKS
jgi:hypothetical protein